MTNYTPPAEKVKILLVEDEENMGNILKTYLEAKNMSVKLCKDGVEGFDAFIKDNFDICILDVMMPQKDGFALAQEIRMIKNVPIIFLTAKSLKEDILNGFKIGADDYITKPFEVEELLLRMKAILKRTNLKTSISSTDKVLRLGLYEFNAEQHLLKLNNIEQKLTSKESELLKLLILSQNDILDRSYALKAIWGDDNYFNSRSMDVYISKLRKFLKDDPNIEILNIHGKGFKLLIKS